MAWTDISIVVEMLRNDAIEAIILPIDANGNVPYLMCDRSTDDFLENLSSKNHVLFYVGFQFFLCKIFGTFS